MSKNDYLDDPDPAELHGAYEQVWRDGWRQAWAMPVLVCHSGMRPLAAARMRFLRPPITGLWSEIKEQVYTTDAW